MKGTEIMTTSWHLFDPYSDPDCDFDAHGRAPYIHDEGGEVIAVMNDAGEHDQEARTNGAILAAAPKLLTALELADATIERLISVDPNKRASVQGTLGVIHRAIAKAYNQPT